MRLSMFWFLMMVVAFRLGTHISKYSIYIINQIPQSALFNYPTNPSTDLLTSLTLLTIFCLPPLSEMIYYLPHFECQKPSLFSRREASPDSILNSLTVLMLTFTIWFRPVLFFFSFLIFFLFPFSEFFQKFFLFTYLLFPIHLLSFLPF